VCCTAATSTFSRSGLPQGHSGPALKPMWMIRPLREPLVVTRCFCAEGAQRRSREARDARPMCYLVVFLVLLTRLNILMRLDFRLHCSFSACEPILLNFAQCHHTSKYWADYDMLGPLYTEYVFLSTADRRPLPNRDTGRSILTHFPNQPKNSAFSVILGPLYFGRGPYKLSCKNSTISDFTSLIRPL
jgi:hypothetical protein